MWASDLSKRPLVSGFLKDKGLGAKRLMSMPDRFTNTVNVNVGGAVCRPSVINNYVGDLGSFDAWWANWKHFMFEAPLTVSTKKGELSQVPYEMLGVIPRAKYPALSEEEERVSLPLQTVCLALFDASLVHMMNTLSPDGTWLTIKRRLCDALFTNKQARTVEILSSSRYAAADVMFLQEVAASFVPKLEAALVDTHTVVTPLKLDAKRDQNSVIVLSKAAFPPLTQAHAQAPAETAAAATQPGSSWVEVTSSVRSLLESAGCEGSIIGGSVSVMDGDVVAVLATHADGQEFLLCSFHGDTNGLQSIPVLEAVSTLSKEQHPSAALLFGLDANVYEIETKGATHVSEWVAAYERLGLASNWGQLAGTDPLGLTRTTYNARTYVQPQLQKAVKRSEFFKGDANPKDYVVFSPAVLEVAAGTERDNTGDGGKVGAYEDTPIPSLVWPSDHSAILMSLRRVPK